MQMMDFINKNNIFFLKENDKTEILNVLILNAVNCGCLKDYKTFKSAIEEREALISTGIGTGIAIPHAVINTIDKFFVMTAILKSPAQWDSLDQKPVDLIFLIGVPENKHQMYLQLLGQIMGVVKNPEKKASILGAKTVDEVLSIFRS